MSCVQANLYFNETLGRQIIVLADKTDQMFISNTISQCSKSLLDSNLLQKIIYAILSTFLDFEKLEKEEMK
ncbi:hypothetical protein A3Q56_00453 [Intoshia linei]|uniref:Uncharacterized protein n=1 Tax=Intoshia linei TaxID=1819745 RepID=A0A177BBQ2_9BILA|nr:hypothetical protein A3Q56_00453 [Intoshia linei]